MLIDINELKNDIKSEIDRFSNHVKKIRTGKATMELFDNMNVEAYGVFNKLTAVGNVIIEDAINVKINIWDRNVIPAVEKAIMDSNMGATVIREIDHVRLKFSPMTEEDRKLRVKDLRSFLEQAKIDVRQVRHKFMKKLESLEAVSEDEQKRDEETVQKEVDEAVKNLDELADKKEKEILSINS